MDSLSRVFFISGCAFGAIGVATGAFGAHALKDAPDMVATFDTASTYQIYHSLALLVLALAIEKWGKNPRPVFRLAGTFFILGILLFSGSLYIYVLAGVRWIVALTPIGGTLFILGWLTPLLLLFRKHRP